MVGKLTSRIVIVSAVITGVCFAEDTEDKEYKRERYDVIVERSPFGEVPIVVIEPDDSPTDADDAADAAAATKEAERELRLCFLHEAEDGVVHAGFENKLAQAGDSLGVTLVLGESYRGMKLLDIDIVKESATLERSGSEVTFDLLKKTKAKRSPKATAAPQRRFGGGFRREPPKAPTKPPEPKVSSEEQAQKREKVRENLRQYQMEVIRAGMPPLPIPLTKDMDNQLVAEGILSPEE